MVGGPPAVPELVATQPAPRATGVLYDSEFWGQFSRPLDGRTVSTTSVFLKLDGQRVPIAVSYDGLTRRIVLRPTVTLELQRTYTAEFSTAVHAADGTPIAPNVYFQFTTNSLRRASYDYPLAGALEGPFVTLGWGGTKGPDGNILYDLYASTDSLEVERRQSPSIAHSVFTRFVPAAAWPMGATVYWSLTSENVTTHERLPGSVRSFRVLDANTPIDSMEIQTRDHGSSDNRLRISNYCNQVEVPSGPNFNCSFHWEYAGIPLGVRLAGATMKLTTTDVNVGSIPAAQPAVHARVARGRRDARLEQQRGPRASGRIHRPGENQRLELGQRRARALDQVRQARPRPARSLAGDAVRRRAREPEHA